MPRIPRATTAILISSSLFFVPSLYRGRVGSFVTQAHSCLLRFHLNIQKVKKASPIQCTIKKKNYQHHHFVAASLSSLVSHLFLLLFYQLGLTNRFLPQLALHSDPVISCSRRLSIPDFVFVEALENTSHLLPTSSPPTHHHPPHHTSPTKTWQPTASPPVCRNARPRIARAFANSTTGASSTPDQSNMSSSSNSNLGKDEVAWYFVEQYYTTLSKSPEKLHVRPISLLPISAQPQLTHPSFSTARNRNSSTARKLRFRRFRLADRRSRSASRAWTLRKTQKCASLMSIHKLPSTTSSSR